MIKLFKQLSFSLLFICQQSLAAPPEIHVWETQEISLTAVNNYQNAYTDVTVWVDLSGPGFNKRVYGFWDGGKIFRVRFVATAPGEWHWASGSEPGDTGLSGQSGSFNAVAWSDEELIENPLRRGFLRSSANHHALIYADSTPYFAIGDTWFPLPSKRFKWYDDSIKRRLGPEAGFKDYVRYRKAQGYNWINVIAAYPNWKTDDKPWQILLDDSARTTLRSAWMEYGSGGSAKNMDNEGGRPFLFPGKVPGYEDYFPDMDRINPEYFKYLDRKIAYLNTNGFVPFVEAARRDMGPLWYKYYKWPHSYSRFIQYIYSRYQAYNTVLSPIHMDIIRETIDPELYTVAIKHAEEKYGSPPFGNLISANAHPSTLENWGEKSWVTLHQIGNVREHNNYWYLTEIFNSPYPQPALNGEPYYAGYADSRGVKGHTYTRGAEGGSEKDNAFVRSCMYGSFLSGGLAGHVYGAEGIWGADIEAEAPVHMWDAFQWKSGSEMQYLKTFALSIGNRYQELVPLPDLVSPNKTHDILGYEGWAYCARTPDKNIFLLYFEKGCPKAEVRGTRLNAFYEAHWFNPRNGSWKEFDGGMLTADNTGNIKLPALPDEMDWGVKLIYSGPNDNNRILPTVIAANSSLMSRVQEKVLPGSRGKFLWSVTLYSLLLLVLILISFLFFKRKRRR